MTKTTLLLIIFLISENCKAQNIYVGLHYNQDRQYKTIKPKMIYETNTFYNDENPKVIRVVKNLDRNGMLSTEDRFSEKGVLYQRLNYTNDTFAMRIQSSVLESFNKGNEKMYLYYSYDSNRCVKSIIQKDSLNRVVDQHEYTCNDKGLPYKVYRIHKNGERILTESAEYFLDKNYVSVNLLSRDGTSNMSDTFKIDNHLACKFPLNGEVYNSNCDQIRHDRYDYSGNPMTIEHDYSYDEFGNITADREFHTELNSSKKAIKRLVYVVEKKYVY